MEVISGAPKGWWEAQVTVGFIVKRTQRRFRHFRVLKGPIGQARRPVTKPTELSRMPQTWKKKLKIYHNNWGSMSRQENFNLGTWQLHASAALTRLPLGWGWVGAHVRCFYRESNTMRPFRSQLLYSASLPLTTNYITQLTQTPSDIFYVLHNKSTHTTSPYESYFLHLVNECILSAGEGCVLFADGSWYSLRP